jgi:hypothetical protein
MRNGNAQIMSTMGRDTMTAQVVHDRKEGVMRRAGEGKGRGGV